MSQITLKDAIRDIERLKSDPNAPIIEVLRPWMTITGLTFKDALHLKMSDAVEGLVRVHDKLGEVLDVLDEDQLQEAACRCLHSITVYGEMISDGEITLRQGQTLVWDGSNWLYTTDARLRQRGSSKSYAEALAAVQEMLGD